MRNDNTAFGEDVHRGYKQTAVFGSMDFDIIPKVLTFTGGTRYYHYSEYEVGSKYTTPLGLPERAERLLGGCHQHQCRERKQDAITASRAAPT